MRERDRYELEKGRLIREMKRIRDEDGSRFNNFQILNHRYALLNLLGKGGFSEVYKVRILMNFIFVNVSKILTTCLYIRLYKTMVLPYKFIVFLLPMLGNRKNRSFCSDLK